MTGVPPFLTSEALRADRVVHGFFTREGGVSAGLYHSLNIGGGSEAASTLIVIASTRQRGRLGT
jgi:hypothetical protein